MIYLSELWWIKEFVCKRSLSLYIFFRLQKLLSFNSSLWFQLNSFGMQSMKKKKQEASS